MAAAAIRAPAGPLSPEQKACAYIAQAQHDGTVTINFFYPETFDPPAPGSPHPQWVTLTPAPNDLLTYTTIAGLLGDHVSSVLPDMCLSHTVVAHSDDGRIDYSPAGRNDIPIYLRQPAVVMLELSSAPSGQCADANGLHPALWTGTAAVPQLGHPYTLPIPRAAIFGTQTVVANFSSAGAVTAVTYGRTSGAAAVLGAATQAVDTARGNTAAQNAADLKGQADEIAQRQRLARCRANPAACTP